MQKSIIWTRVALTLALSASACASADDVENRPSATVESTSQALQKVQDVRPTVDHEAAFQESQRLRLTRQEHYHAALVEQLGLAQGEAQRVLALLRASAEAQQRMVAYMRKNRKATREQLVKEFSNNPEFREGLAADTNEKIAALLGPSGYAKYSDLRGTKREWYVPVR